MTLSLALAGFGAKLVSDVGYLKGLIAKTDELAVQVSENQKKQQKNAGTINTLDKKVDKKFAEIKKDMNIPSAEVVAENIRANRYATIRIRDAHAERVDPSNKSVQEDIEKALEKITITKGS